MTTATESESRPAPATGTPAAHAPSSGGGALRFVIGTALLAGLLYFGLTSAVRNYTRISTDDAFTDTHIVTVAPKVACYVAQVHVVENQTVKAGDLLVELDSRDLQSKRQQKQAAADTATANYHTVISGLSLVQARKVTAEASRKQAEADAAAAAATAERAQADLLRSRELKERNVISPQEADLAENTAKTAAANALSAKEKLAGEAAKVQETVAQEEAARALVATAEAQVKQAQVDVAAADLDLTYTKLFAAQDGRVTKKAVEPGAYVQVGQSLMAVVSPSVWVSGNFKESQLDHIVPGQPVEIEIDAYPEKIYRGHVDGIQSGTGARFSLLPAENAVGNFVKVVQRVPVKILFDEPPAPNHVLGPGMSVTPSIVIRNTAVSSGLLLVVSVVLGAILMWILGKLLGRKKA